MLVTLLYQCTEPCNQLQQLTKKQIKYFLSIIFSFFLIHSVRGEQLNLSSHCLLAAARHGEAMSSDQASITGPRKIPGASGEST